MTSSQKFVLILVFFIGGLAFLLRLIPGGGEPHSGELRTDIAESRDLMSVVPASGEVLPLLSSIVISEISGRIMEIKVEEGDAVVRDQVLLELDRTSLETRLREAQRNLEAERLRLEKSQRNNHRLKDLFEENFVGEKEYLDAKTELKLAEINLEIAQARLEDAAEDLSKSVISAPHDGVVTLMDVLEGQVISGATSVSNGTGLLTIAELDELYMEANINEVDVERLFLGQKAFLRFDAIPEFEVEGTINVIAPSARKDGNVRVFPVEVFFEVTDKRVRPGISATVEVPIASVEGVVSVLISGVFTEDQSSHVYLKTATGWKKQKVEVGINDLQHVEINNGLDAEDVIALSRPPEFRNNDE
jgi:HlyD family secretion protein